MRSTPAQRLVMVVTYGLVLLSMWRWVEVQGWSQFGGGPNGGWFNYAPNAGVRVDTGGWRLAAQLGFIAVWAGPSLWMLRASPSRSGPTESPKADVTDEPPFDEPTERR